MPVKETERKRPRLERDSLCCFYLSLSPSFFCSVSRPRRRGRVGEKAVGSRSTSSSSSSARTNSSQRSRQGLFPFCFAERIRGFLFISSAVSCSPRFPSSSPHMTVLWRLLLDKKEELPCSSSAVFVYKPAPPLPFIHSVSGSGSSFSLLNFCYVCLLSSSNRSRLLGYLNPQTPVLHSYPSRFCLDVYACILPRVQTSGFIVYVSIHPDSSCTTFLSMFPISASLPVRLSVARKAPFLLLIVIVFVLSTFPGRTLQLSFPYVDYRLLLFRKIKKIAHVKKDTYSIVVSLSCS